MSLAENYPAQDIDSIEEATQTREDFLGYCMILGTIKDMYSQKELENLYGVLQVIGQKYGFQAASDEPIAQIIPLSRNRAKAS
jgi:hypothetical protein